MLPPQHLLTLLMCLAVLGAKCGDASAGLRDIYPRPQQMGLLGPQPVRFTGTPYLVVPDNLTIEESRVRGEALRMMAMTVNRLPEVVSWSQYQGQEPAIWLGTLQRLPALAAALDSVGIAGLGTTTHSEEYQLVVQDHRVLLGGSDPRGLRWGLQALMELMADVQGQLFVDRAYVRDWPDFPVRVGTLNGSVNIPSQTEFAHKIVDASYAARMNEIEWNGSGLYSTRLRPYFIQQSTLLINKMRNYGMTYSASAEATGKSVSYPHWQEGVPIRDMRMRVTDSSFVPVANGYNVQIPNAGWENWNGARPHDWYMYRDYYFDYVSRDEVTRHSGGSSIRYTGFNSSTPTSMDVRQNVVIGSERMLKIKLWVKLANYTGRVRILFLGLTEPRNRYEDRFYYYNTPTTQDWTLLEFEFRSFDADTVLLMVGPYAPTGGTIWLDDVSIETGGVRDIVRRADTPLDVYDTSPNRLLAEGVDYRVVERDTAIWEQYVRVPRIERIPGGRLAVGDTVRVNWYSGMKINGESGKATQCFSLLDPLLEFQDRIARLDSFGNPDGFKIHINEVSYANCDPLCASRNLSSAQLVGSYCRQLYDIIQARRPGAPVRIYGDAFDIYVEDMRAMPNDGHPPWTRGALEFLPPDVQMMAMTDYSRNMDSSFAYFAGQGHDALMSVALWKSMPEFVNGMIAGHRSSNCEGVQFYFWEGDVSDAVMQWKSRDVGALGWNMGPFILHTPPAGGPRPDSLVIRAEMWTDSFHINAPVSLTGTTLNYRLLPTGTWTSMGLVRTTTDLHGAVIRSITPGVTGVEYYLSVTDHRGMTSTAPADAPQRVFRVMFGGGSAPAGGQGGEEIGFSTTGLPGGTLLEWQPVEQAAWYEVHVGETVDFSEASPSRIARQTLLCPRFFCSLDQFTPAMLDALRVFAVQDRKPRKPLDPKPQINRLAAR